MSFEERIIIINFIYQSILCWYHVLRLVFFRILDGWIRVLLQMIVDEYVRISLFTNWNIFKMFTLSKIDMVNFYSDGKIVFVYFVFFFFQWRKSFYLVFPKHAFYPTQSSPFHYNLTYHLWRLTPPQTPTVKPYPPVIHPPNSTTPRAKETGTCGFGGNPSVAWAGKEPEERTSLPSEPSQVRASRGHGRPHLSQRCRRPLQPEDALLRQTHLRKSLTNVKGLSQIN